MSNQPAAATPQNRDEAYNTLYMGVYAPRFFEKLASHGVRPADNDEATLLLEMAGQLRALHDDTASSESTIKAAHAKLQGVCAKRGVVQADASATKRASDRAGNPQFAHAALSLIHASTIGKQAA